MLNFIPMGSSEVGKGYLYSDKSRKMMFPDARKNTSYVKGTKIRSTKTRQGKHAQ